MRLIDADAFDRDLCNHRFTAALNEAADAGTAFEDKEMYYSTQSFRDVMKYRPTIEAVPIKAISAWLAAYAAPPNYALEAICNDIDPASIVYTANDRARAWEYHWQHLMECGLLQEDNHGETGDM